jgi:hypothetical protein
MLALEKSVRESVQVLCDAVPATLLRYFQQILPLAKCDAGDGRVVGQLLVDLLGRNPKDLPRAIREFADRTAMLRDCGFAHIGDMLARLLSANLQGRPDDDATAIASTSVRTVAIGLDRSALTEKQAIAIGSAIAWSVHQAHALAAGLKKVVKSHGALQAMRSQYAWFMPMLEVVMAHKAAQPRGSVVVNRLRSIISPVASIDVALHADAADEESGFSSVVRLGAHGPRLAVCPLASDALMPCGPRLALVHCLVPAEARHHRCLRMPLRARSSIRRSQSPLQLPRRWARLRMTRLMSEVNLRCRTLHSGGVPLCALPIGTLRTCTGPRRSEQYSRSGHPPKAMNPTETPLECLAGRDGNYPC